MTYSKPLIVAAALLCLFPFMSSGMALLLGLGLALWTGNPFAHQSKLVSARLLQFSVVGLGAGINLTVILKAGMHGMLYTLVGIALTLWAGFFLGRKLKNKSTTSLLLCTGTAICGGSAIAAVAPVINASDEDVSLSLATVFSLNAVALFIFPTLGHWFNLDETQFGYWSALAIHDTSSVVGASMQYGNHALELATTVKLTRALWIIPIAFTLGLVWPKQLDAKNGQPKYPWFILGFIILAALVTYFPALQSAGSMIQSMAKRTLVLTLFLIGLGVPKAVFLSGTIKRVFIQGVALWILVGAGTLYAVKTGWIQ